MRIFEADLQERAFRALGLSDEEIAAKFDFMVSAF